MIIRIASLLLLCAFLCACPPPPVKPPAAAPIKPVKVHKKAIASDNLWVRLRAGFKLSHYRHTPAVRAQIDWYRQHPRHVRKIAQRAAPYLYYIYQRIKQRGLPTELALLPMIESAYNPFAHSHAGAAGLWQIMPRTAKHLGLHRSYWYDGRRDIPNSTHAALNYLQYLYDAFDDNWLLALAAYDSGEGRVMNAAVKNLQAGRHTDFWTLELPDETQAYVPKLLALAVVIQEPNKYGLTLPPIAAHPVFEMVKIHHPLNLRTAAHLAGITAEALYHLNPGYNHWKTAPHGPHRLILPQQLVKAFKKRLARHWRYHSKRYRVTRGDSLWLIAKQYHVPITTLRKVNKLHSDRLRIGQHLIIPPNHKQHSHSHHHHASKH